MTQALPMIGQCLGMVVHSLSDCLLLIVVVGVALWVAGSGCPRLFAPGPGCCRHQCRIERMEVIRSSTSVSKVVM